MPLTPLEKAYNKRQARLAKKRLLLQDKNCALCAISLAEAISLDKRFMYSAPLWKHHLSVNLLGYPSENSSNGLFDREDIECIKLISRLKILLTMM